ncbi:hypothetical protein BDW59DRAFT_16477 [Aspergillus cavernicola]|uniref:Uncharacterized protein n=1 Tax=Aspergillus cavernicola TaxID=176166 RepID=A0ABR4HIE4_9EURO
MSSLSKSRWAPNSRASPERAKNLLTPTDELSRFMKIVARLRWKLPFLAEAYRLATLPVDQGFDVAEAEIMFKLDFHEYYALLERALVHLLGVFGISVSAASKDPGWAGSHRYHANVLDAVEAKTSPLRSVLGSGDRYRQLKRAKELRNRWKTADLSPDEKPVMPLESYDLDRILAGVFDGLEDGYHLAEAHASQHDTSGTRSRDPDRNWDFIVDAMDWEAV